ncbi:MAG: DUF1353 domain-containing protein [Nitrosomonadales bacterium]|nr:DUF1353 domain-containing protein [Nitrosomonadales bacterium]
MSRFTSILLVSPLSDGRTWLIRSEFGYDVGTEGSGDTINVPVNFRTDFASTPRFLWVIFPPWGKYGNAAVIHDFLYWTRARPRSECDRIFLEAMQVLEVGTLTRHAMYRAVRLFGWFVWWNNPRRKRKGYDKIGQPVPDKAVALVRMK